MENGFFTEMQKKLQVLGYSSQKILVEINGNIKTTFLAKLWNNWVTLSFLLRLS